MNTNTTNNINKDQRRIQAEREALKLREKEFISQQQRALKRQKEFRENTYIWNNVILLKWYEFQTSHKVKEMCYKGIPPNIRGKVWPLMIKNELKIDAELFEQLNIEVIQVYGVNFSSNRKPPSDEAPPHISAYRDSLLNIFDEAHPLYPSNYHNQSSSISTTTSNAEEYFITNKETKSSADCNHSNNSTIIPYSNKNSSSSQDYNNSTTNRSNINITSSKVPVVSLDITNEVWFENERNTSMRPSDYDFIQKQFFQYPQDANKMIQAANSLSPTHYKQQPQQTYNNHYDNDHNNVINISNNSNSTIGNENSLIDSPCSTTPQGRTRQYSEGYMVNAGLIVNNNSKPSKSLKDNELISEHGNQEQEYNGNKCSSNITSNTNNIYFNNASPSTGSYRSNTATTRNSNVSVDGASALLANDAAFIMISNDNYFDTNHTHSYGKHHNSNNDNGGDDEEEDVFTVVVSEDNGIHHHLSPSKSITDDVLISSFRKHTISLATKYSEQEKTHLFNSMSLIEWDLPRTYPTLGFFHDGGPMHTGLERVLMCYVCYKPNLGYVQGMSYLVATLLLYMDEFEAFRCLCNLLEQPLTMQFFSIQKQAIEGYVLCFSYYFKKLLPLLFTHMENEGISAEMYLMDWIMSLFTKTLHLEVAARIWDIYLFEGEMYLLTVALGILKMYAARLSTFKLEKILAFLLHLPQELNSEELFQSISQIQISKSNYDKIRSKMAIKSYGSTENYKESLKKMQDNTRRNNNTCSSRNSSCSSDRSSSVQKSNDKISLFDICKQKSIQWLKRGNSGLSSNTCDNNQSSLK